MPFSADTKLTQNSGIDVPRATTEEVLGLAATYMEIYFLGITAHMLYNFCASMVRAAGDTKSPLVILTAAGVVNVGLNILFVRYLGRNVDGVAGSLMEKMHTASLKEIVSITQAPTQPRQSPYVREL